MIISEFKYQKLINGYMIYQVLPFSSSEQWTVPK